MTDDLIKRLRALQENLQDGDAGEAADVLEAKDARIADLRKEADMMHSEYKTAAARIEWLEEWIRTINGAGVARIAALEAALKPFADAETVYDEYGILWISVPEDDLRAARAAMKGK